jgi:tetratricopeptide (TPR) repeat protein
MRNSERGTRNSSSLESTAVDSNRQQSTAIEFLSRALGSLLVACSLLLAVLPSAIQAAGEIPAAALAPLQAELAALATSRASSSTKRRTCKGVIRDAQALVRANPDAPNRFPVLALKLKAQQRLLQMENTERNREAFFATCKALTEAPDAYSRYRLNAELMLAERDLSARDADVAERIAALAAMRTRYRDTPGELEFLMAAVKIATQLGDYEFKEQLVTDLSERFADSPTAINYRRTLIGATRMDIVFSGTFERVDGTTMTFPFDRLGHAYYAIFWSKESEASLAKLKQLKQQQDEAPGLLELYSFNVDELPDAGASILKSVGLECTVLRLPGGVQSETFRTYALHMPAALRVNHFGHAIVPPSMAIHFKNAEEAKAFAHSSVYDEFAYPRMEATGHVSSYGEYDRHLSQIQSLLIGDLLVAAARGASSQIPKDPNSQGAVGSLDAIQGCFLPVPYRYRLSTADALANYEKANELCAKAIAAMPGAPELWRVRNYRIVALMGIASLSGSHEPFKRAVEEARTTVGLDLPDGAGVVARFCLAKAALRQGDESAKTIVDGLVADCGGEKASLRAHTAAAILAMHADAREIYQQHRSAILESSEHPQELASFVAFLRDRYHQYYVFRGNPIFYLYSREYRFEERRHLIDVGLTPVTLPLPKLQLKGLDGKTVSLPDTKRERLTLLLFVEPPADGSNELAQSICSLPPEPTTRNPNPQLGGLLGSAYGLARRPNNGLQHVTVFLTDDVAKAKSIRDKYALPGLVTTLPGGVRNPVVNELGILSADRNVNAFLIRRDGTIAWSKNGLPYQMSGRLAYIAPLAWESQVSGVDTEAGCRALKARDYKKSVQLFSGTYLETVEADAPILPHQETSSKWKASRFHGRALAHLGLKEYDAALEYVDKAITWHLSRNQFNHDPEDPCTTMLHLQTTRSKALDGLGRSSEARTARNKAAVKPTHYPTHYSRIRGFNEPYEKFEEKMSIVAKEIE